MSKAPSQMDCQCAVSRQGANSCVVQLRKLRSISVTGGAGSFSVPLDMWAPASPAVIHRS